MSADQLPDRSTDFGRMVHERLASEHLIWLTTVGKDGTPQPNPVWFLHEDGEILVYNIKSANRLVHIKNRPRVALNFDADSGGNSIVVITGIARAVPDEPLPTANPSYLAKYAEPMVQVSGDADKFASIYNQAIRIDIAKVRGF
ncbi:MAG TPA: TIGR03667 family PPOX class F420-dependent oxidoreductase [Pseudonocardiaceae bacterium]|jgi:PPOX class probable F420-dependent enzyme|nr:TIGR03667 family PPOX class F420-dependent oxidoreductase [Pseudonocardiaceae bacterium]